MKIILDTELERQGIVFDIHHNLYYLRFSVSFFIHLIKFFIHVFLSLTLHSNRLRLPKMLSWHNKVIIIVRKSVPWLTFLIPRSDLIYKLPSSKMVLDPLVAPLPDCIVLPCSFPFLFKSFGLSLYWPAAIFVYINTNWWPFRPIIYPQTLNESCTPPSFCSII